MTTNENRTPHTLLKIAISRLYSEGLITEKEYEELWTIVEELGEKHGENTLHQA